MVHIDEKFKDDSPVKTVERIVQLLREHHIEAVEKWNDSGIENCCSVRVSIGDTSMSSYGKGVTRELARASGYAELMERLQSGHLCSGKRPYPDAKAMTRSELMEHSGEWLQKMADGVVRTESKECPVDKILDNVFSYGEQSTVNTIPFYNPHDDRKVYLPENLISRLYSTNGLAAGNSREEALVQGFSEVVERYCHCRIIRESIVPPSVPDDYLAQYPTAYGIISAMREAGYQVIIKDCSLGEGYPVVASVVIDRKRHGYRVNVGSSPVFEIALERCLTEIMQGRNIETLQMIPSFASKKNRSAADIVLALGAGNAAYPLDFFDGEPTYPFVPFADRSNDDNKVLLRYIMDYLEQHNRTMLIRDLSHMGFHTYRILVPGISEVFGFAFLGAPSLLRMGYEIKDVRQNPKEATPDQLQIYSLLYQTTPKASQGPLTLTEHSLLPLKLPLKDDTYYGLLAEAYVEWQIRNYSKVLRYVQSAIMYAPDEKKDLINCVSVYVFNILSGFSSDETIQKMGRFFDAAVLAQLETAMKESSNPFATLFPTCDNRCDSCHWTDICTKAEDNFVAQQLNNAVSQFDAVGAFEAMAATFRTVKEYG